MLVVFLSLCMYYYYSKYSTYYIQYIQYKSKQWEIEVLKLENWSPILNYLYLLIK